MGAWRGGECSIPGLIPDHWNSMELTPPIVLVAEDNEDDEFFNRRALQAAPAQSTLTYIWNGDEAVEYLVGPPHLEDPTRYPLPSVVVLDLKLPRRTGLEVLRWIREHAATASVHVIVLSSSEQESDLNR